MHDENFKGAAVRQVVRTAVAVMGVVAAAIAGLGGAASALVLATPAHGLRGEPNVGAAGTTIVRLPAHLVWFTKMYPTGCDIIEFLQFPAVRETAPARVYRGRLVMLRRPLPSVVSHY
jgi:hypothetical protein